MECTFKDVKRTNSSNFNKIKTIIQNVNACAEF